MVKYQFIVAAATLEGLGPFSEPIVVMVESEGGFTVYNYGQKSSMINI